VSSPHHPPSSRVRLICLIAVSTAVASMGALAILAAAILTLFRARRLYAGLATSLARALLRIWSVRLEILAPHGWPRGQVVYVSNHPSTLDLFVLVALGLPNTRFFLSGYLKKYLPIGIVAGLMGTFFTVTQDRSEQRVRIFQRATRILKETGESIYLSPEGQRVATGEIGAFNKGAFHLATVLQAPIVPLFFDVPDAVNPGVGLDIGPGTIGVHVLPPIDTTRWRVADVATHRDAVRALFRTWNVTLRRTA
jgi:1-acyl-sn-glycerol-3-phosphate acyltransferase